jgi:hypothetical protein
MIEQARAFIGGVLGRPNGARRSCALQHCRSSADATKPSGNQENHVKLLKYL